MVYRCVRGKLLPSNHGRCDGPRRCRLLNTRCGSMASVTFGVMNEHYGFSAGIGCTLSSFFFQLRRVKICSFRSVARGAMLRIFSGRKGPGVNRSLGCSIRCKLGTYLPRCNGSIRHVVTCLPSVPGVQGGVRCLARRRLATVERALRRSNAVSLRSGTVVALTVCAKLHKYSVSTLALSDFS